MKTAYSTFSNPAVWEYFKRRFKNHSEEDYCKLAHEVLHIREDLKHSATEAMTLYANVLMTFLWKFRTLQHFFLADGVKDFCIGSVREFTSEYCKRLPPCNDVATPCANKEYPFAMSFAKYGMGRQDRMAGGFAIHFPAKEKRGSLMVIPEAMIPAGAPQGINIPEGYSKRTVAARFFFAATDGKQDWLMKENAEIEFQALRQRDEGWIPKLIFGLSLYMDAFPDAVVEAGTENVHQIKHYDGIRYVVNRNEIVDEEHRHNVSPHWRRGHFRLLASEKFVHKHGQTVYVRGTFVKGKAFDVLEDAPSSVHPALSTA
jgi:hypothetical protein